jgi:hypothetical protein
MIHFLLNREDSKLYVLQEDLLPVARVIKEQISNENIISPFTFHGASLIRPFCITILYHNLLLFIDIFHI